MMRHVGRLVLVSLLTGLALAAWPRYLQARSVHAGWTLPEHGYRRLVEVTDKQRQAGTAFVTFDTFGNVRPDGADVAVRVGRSDVPSRVLAVSPTGRVSLVFEAVRGQKRYHVYYGGPAVERSKDRWQPAAGLIVTGGPLGKARPRKWDDIKKFMADDARAVHGAEALDTLHLGYNPFGPSDDFYQHFVGYLQAPKAGEYELVMAPGNIGVLLVNGAFVAHQQNRYPPRRIVPQIVRKVKLKAGGNRIDFYNIFEHGRPSGTLLWKPPGSDKFAIVPAKAWVPLVEVEPGQLEVRESRIAADFSWENREVIYYSGEDEWVLIPDEYRGRMAVKTHFKVVGARDGWRVRWDFGGGRTSTKRELDHVFLSGGPHTVKLTVQGGTYKHTTEYTLEATIPWHRQATHYIKPRSELAPVVEAVDVKKLTTDSLDNLMLYWFREKKYERIETVAPELLLGDRKLPDPRRLATTRLAGNVICYKEENYDLATRLFVTAARKMTDPKLSAKALLEGGMMMLRKQYKYEAARKVFERVLKEYGDKDRLVKREALISLGHVDFFDGQGKRARQYYSDAARIKVVNRDARGDTLARSSYARSVEGFIMRNDWEFARQTLEKWDWEYPMDRLEGYNALAWGKYYAARQEYHMAAFLCESLYRASPKSNFADQCLDLAAECYTKIDNEKKAREMWRILDTEYPESPLAPRNRKDETEKAGAEVDKDK
ncbi:MAG: PKD domain-containing protein [Planctomycetota bacterium]